MKKALKSLVNLVHILSLCGLILAGLLGVIYEIIGPVKFDQLLSKIGIANASDNVLLFGAVMLLLLVITYFIKTKCFENQNFHPQGHQTHAQSSPPRRSPLKSKMASMKKLLEFTDFLAEKDINYRFNEESDNWLIEIFVPGQRWEVEFLPNGEVQVEKFISEGHIYSESVLAELAEF